MKKIILFITLALLSIHLNAQLNTEEDNLDAMMLNEGTQLPKEKPSFPEIPFMTKGPVFGDLERISIPSFPQTAISGIVQNEAGEVLIGASIIAYNENRLLGGTTTSLYGAYELATKNDPAEIEISYLGYQPIRKDMQYFLDNPIVILKKGIDLPAIEVTARKDISTGIGCSLWATVYSNSKDVIASDSVAMNLALGLRFNSTKWQVYPNPTVDKITVKTVFSEGVFKLIAATGQTLKTISVQELQTDVYLNEYPTGSYYLRYESETWSETFGPVVKIKM